MTGGPQPATGRPLGLTASNAPVSCKASRSAQSRFSQLLHIQRDSYMYISPQHGDVAWAPEPIRDWGVGWGFADWYEPGRFLTVWTGPMVDR
jgi:hypothetical protein